MKYLRWVVTDPRSAQDSATITNEFEVNLSWECHSNTVSLGNSGEGIVDWSYEMDGTAVSQAASVSQLYSDCPTAISMSCEVRNFPLSDGGDWITATSSEGVISCNLSDGFEI